MHAPSASFFQRPSFCLMAVVLFVLASSMGFAGLPAYDPPANYYSTANTTNAATLRSSLHNIIDNHVVFPYTSSATDTWNILDSADQNPANSSQVIDVYKNAAYPKAGGGNSNYNREHTWPNSLGYPSESYDAYTDCHALWISNDSYNSSRSNNPYGSCISSCDPTDYPTDVNNGVGGSGNPDFSNYLSNGLWETWIGRRGDVARAMFYMDIRYEGDAPGDANLTLTDNESLIQTLDVADTNGVAYMGLLSDLLEWHQQDPVDEYERRRNHIVFGFQQNRNPFIDHPEWVCIIYNQGVCADVFPPATPTGLVATAGNGAVSLNWNDNTEPDFTTYTLYRSTTSGSGFTPRATGLTASSFLDSPLTNGTTYYYRVAARDSVNESNQSAQQSATPNTGGQDFTPPAAPSGFVATAGNATVGLAWNANGEADLAGYNLYRGASASGPFLKQNVSLLTGTSTTDSTVSNGTTYYYVLTARDNAANESVFSTVRSATPSAPAVVGSAWINEFHYDNAGTDSDEFIEIAGTAGLNLSGWTIVLYNGPVTYGTAVNLSTAAPSSVIPNLENCFGVVSITYPTDGLQNGGSDGFALVNNLGEVVQFLSYEGTITATAGPASGLTSVDVGRAETTTTPVGQSLQLSGTNGTAYASFAWQTPQTATKGAFNTGQTFANGCTVSDTTPPTVQITSISPDPRNTAVSSVEIIFSEPVQNVSKTNLVLTRNEISVSLAAATLTNVNSTAFTLGSLSGLTALSGDYLVTLSIGSITDNASNALVAGDLQSWTMDVDAPLTQVTAPATAQNNSTGIFPISYSFSDGTGVGTSEVRLFYSTNGTNFTQYQGTFAATGTLDFNLALAGGDATYRFYTIGVDDLGNTETAPVGGFDVSVSLSATSAAPSWVVY